ncbi:hypothetical protein A8926_5076 [Saccharopolyspora spinosa]|uniref:Uncharacterized protein n=1 Tax=Saccharopolyspora spinosa TaxID=60894 RepID=A0A2N3Y2J3_SACSN|nr:hypothetical protein A8926_5076 [Saccharopolyspora spinosa]
MCPSHGSDGARPRAACGLAGQRGLARRWVSGGRGGARPSKIEGFHVRHEQQRPPRRARTTPVLGRAGTTRLLLKAAWLELHAVLQR